MDFKIRNSRLFKTNLIFNETLPPNIILGSSRALTGIDTKLFCELTGKEWYNLSIDDTPIETHLLQYKLLVSQNKIPSVLLLQYDNTSNDNGINNNIHEKDYQFLPFNSMNNKELKEYITNKNAFEGYLFYYIPFWKYFYFSTELLFAGLRSILQPDYQHRYFKHGDYAYPEGMENVSKPCSGKKSENINFSNNRFNELVKLCTKNNTKLIVYTAPYRCLNINSSRSSNNEAFSYFNYSQLIRENLDFHDEIHLSNLGKIKITEIIAKELNSLLK